MSGYLLLFASAFGAATLLPFYSEVVFLALLEKGLLPGWLWLAATTGNTAGSVVNWFIGLKYSHLEGTRWFPVNKNNMARARGWFGRYGYWTLLLAWLPVGGDALTFIGGILRVRLPVFLILVAIGKGARYGALLVGFNLLAHA